MRVGLYYPGSLPESFRVCADNIARELEVLGVAICRFDAPDHIPADVQLLWDPRAGGGNPPVKQFLMHPLPLVVTLHGAAPMVIPLREYFDGYRERYWGWRGNKRKVAAWRAAQDGYDAVVTVSKSSRESILANLPIAPEKISWCHNAVDHTFFSPASKEAESPYFLHISNDEPRKNVDDICDAYARLSQKNKPRLLLKLPRDSKRISANGIEVLRERIPDNEILKLYQQAFAFIFPSSFEGFGLPIVEAMAAGCPVITASTHACGEVAGAAAITVKPRDTKALTAAMRSLCEQPEKRISLRDQGLLRAKDFSWENAAKHYYEVFENVLGAR